MGIADPAGDNQEARELAPKDECSDYLWPAALWRRACRMLVALEKHKGVFVAGLAVALFAEMVSFVFASSWYTKELYVTRFTGLSQAPFAIGEVPIPYPEHRLRLLGPVIAWAVGLGGSIRGALIPILASIPLLGLVYLFVRRRSSVQMGLVSVMLLATTHLTMTSRTILGYHDSLVYLCCLGALMTRRTLLRGSLLFLALYGDVRAVMVCPFILIWPVDADDAMPPLGEMARRAMVCVVSIALWAVSAKLLLQLFEYDQMAMDRLAMHMKGELMNIKPSILHLSVFMAFKAAWLFVLVPIWMIGQRNWFWGAYLAIALIGIAGPSILVTDISRALGFCFPLILLGLVELWRRVPQTAVVAAGTCLVVNLSSPFYHGFTWGLWEISYPLPLELVRRLID